MICLRISEDGIPAANQSKLTFDKPTSQFHLDNTPIPHKSPIGLHHLQNRTYIHLTPSLILLTHPSSIPEFEHLLTRHNLKSLKVPDKSTQELAAMEYRDEQCSFVHCGTWNSMHDCYTVVRGQEVFVKDWRGGVVFGAGVSMARFDDLESKMYFGDEECFYFWKQMEYLSAKASITMLTQMQPEPPILIDPDQQLIQQNELINEPMVQQKISYFRPEEEVRQVVQQPLIEEGEAVQYGKQEKEEEEAEEEEDKGNQMIPGKKMIKKEERSGKKEYQRTIRKVLQSQIQNERTTKKKPSPQHPYPQPQPQNYQSSNQPQNLQQSSFPQASESHSLSPNRLLTSVIKLALQNYSQSQYRVQLCGLNGCDVIDIRAVGEQRFLWYHCFEGEALGAVSRQLCELRFVDDEEGEEEEGVEVSIKPTKLVFDPRSNTVFYNNPDRSYLHSFNLTTQAQSHYYLKKPIIDMVQNKQGEILGIHLDQIFKFDTLASKKRIIARYKTVKNLSKVSAVFGDHYYATASEDGRVRTYDIRNNFKASNRFPMASGITSLQVSDGGGYILCRYGHKAHILSCKDVYENSVFTNRARVGDRKKSRTLVKGFENLSHIQFLRGAQREGDLVAVDDSNPCRLVVKNIDRRTPEKLYPLPQNFQELQYLKCYDKWVIYGNNGSYYRMKIQ